MKKIMIELPEIKLIGITARTNNAGELDLSTAQIGATIQSYFGDNFPSLIPCRIAPGTTYCVYSDYASDHAGDYTYFIGEIVTSFEVVPQGMTTLTIPAQKYAKFTSASGPMPAVCIDMWEKIWSMTPAEMGGERAYKADFEVYDERAADPRRTKLDIYIGLRV